MKANAKLITAASQVAKRVRRRRFVRPQGRKGDDVLKILERLGYRFRKFAETAASGQSDVPDVVKSWMDAPENRKFVLGDFTEAGVGYAVSPRASPTGS